MDGAGKIVRFRFRSGRRVLFALPLFRLRPVQGIGDQNNSDALSAGENRQNYIRPERDADGRPALAGGERGKIETATFC